MDNSCLRLLGKDGRIIKLQFQSILLFIFTPQQVEKRWPTLIKKKNNKKKKIKPQTPNSTHVLVCAHTYFLHRFPEERGCTKSYSRKETKPSASLKLPQILIFPPVSQAGTNARRQPSSQSAPSAAACEVLTLSNILPGERFRKGRGGGKNNTGLGSLSPSFWKVCWVFYPKKGTFIISIIKRG